MARPSKANSKESSKRMKGENLRAVELSRRAERLHSMDFDCFGYKRKFESGINDLSRGTDTSEYTLRKSWWHEYPNANFHGALDTTLVPTFDPPYSSY